MDSYGTKA